MNILNNIIFWELITSILTLIGAFTVLKWIFLLIRHIILTVKKAFDREKTKKSFRVVPKSPELFKPKIDYYKTEYYNQTKEYYHNILKNPGKLGEYNIYTKIIDYENAGSKFLFNCYLNKENGETTEIDVIMINVRGIFVFESKNYSGWIFGNQKNLNWTQCLPNKSQTVKEQFYNPIKQNSTHINVLRKYIEKPLPYYNIVVFADTATLKDITVEGDYIRVTNLKDLRQVLYNLMLEHNEVLNLEEINQIYSQLYPYTQVPKEVKEQHIKNIQKNKSPE